MTRPRLTTTVRAPMRVAVVDLGSNSTRLLVADIQGDDIVELERRTKVTRLGQAVEQTGVLADEAMGRVCDTLVEYRAIIDDHGVATAVGVLTSAVRDARNGDAFTQRVRDDFGLDARTITGDEEAQLTYLGALAHGADQPTVVIDIGGGSTEFVVGHGDRVSFHVSTQAGVVRHTERHIAHDPPTPAELEALARDVRALFAPVRATAEAAIAVAGTPLSLAAIDRDLECHESNLVHGAELSVTACRRILARLQTLPEAERRQVRGLLPDRAPTIIAGAVMLLEALAAFGLDRTAVSDRDILHGAALKAVRRARAEGPPPAR